MVKLKFQRTKVVAANIVYTNVVKQESSLEESGVALLIRYAMIEGATVIFVGGPRKVCTGRDLDRAAQCRRVVTIQYKS